MSSKKFFELNLSSIKWFVRKLSCFACLAFFVCAGFSFSFSLFSKEIKSSLSSSNLFIINSRSSLSSSFIDYSKRDFFFLSFFSCSISYISWIFFHSISRSSISCNNSTNIKRWFFVISLICLMRAFSVFRVITSFVCILSRFIRQIFINSALIRFFFIIFLFLQFCDDELFRILCNKSQIIYFES